MKKFFYFVAALVISCAAMTSCDDKAATVETEAPVVDSIEVVTDTVCGDTVIADTVWVASEEVVAE